MPKANVAGIGLQEVQGGGEFWLHFVQGQLMAVQSRPSLQRAVFSSSLGAHVLQNVHGEMGWTRAAGEWHLSAQHLTARLDNVAWPVPTLALHGKERHLSVAASGIDMGAAALLANRLPLPDALAEWLREATPAGQTSVGVELEQGEQDQWQTQQVTARFSQLGVHATTRFPGGSNLAGWAYWTPSMSLLGLDVKNGQLDLRPTEIQRNFGMAWGVGGWLLFSFLHKIGPAAAQTLRERVASELKTTFASHYARRVSLADALSEDAIAFYGPRNTGAKVLIDPSM